MDIEKLLNADRLEVHILRADVHGGYIRALRMRNRLSVTALADILNVSKRQIEKWEKKGDKIMLKGSTAMLVSLLWSYPTVIDYIYYIVE